MTEILQIVLTRFNIASPGREAAIRNSPGWLERRFDLFERYCLPSMAAQTVRDFHWLVYFDANTPTSFRERIERAKVSFPFTARFVDFFDAALPQAEVAAFVGGTTNLVVTTRLDNDDAVSRDFMERIRAAALRRPSGTVLNFTNGLALHGGQVYTASDTSNPFTSLVERDAREPRTIWSVQHHLLGEHFTLEQVSAPPVWLQVIHGENVSNRIRGKRLSRTAVIDNFALHPNVQIAEARPAAVVIDNLVLWPLRRMREAIFRLVKPLVKGLRGNA